MIYRFAGVELDVGAKELRHEGRVVAIAPKAYSVLAYLVENRDRLVTKVELLDTFWSANVSEAALQTTISLVRKALQVAPGQKPAIRTYHGQGFRLVSPVEILSPPTGSHGAVELKPVQERRLIAVLCARLNIVGAEVSTDDSNAVAADFLAFARGLVDAEQGKLIRMTMDGFMVSFGLDPHFEDGARRAAYCAWHLAQYDGGARFEPTRVTVAIGLETGPVTQAAGDTAWSQPEEIERNASALAQQAGHRAIHVNETTRSQLGDEVTTEPVTGGYRLTSPPQRRSGIPARPHSRPTRFVGRSSEHAFLCAAWASATSGSGRSVTLSGPAGIGKTRLVSEFLTSQSETGRTALIRCLPGLRDRALAPVREMCRTLFRDHAKNRLEDKQDQALLNWLMDDTTRSDPLLDSMSDQVRRTQGRDLILRLLTDICAAQPVILVVEDMHWLDSESRIYVDAIARSAGSMALLLLITTRPERDLLSDTPVIHLAPLAHDESLTLLGEMPETDRLSATDAHTLARRAAGNPFFLEELALAFGLSGDVDSKLPETVQAVIEVRIADLELRARTLVYVFSVAGPSADLALIAELTGLPDTVIEPELARLVGLGFLTADSGGYGFRHILLQETAYAMIVPSDRRDLHRQIARFLTTEPTDRPARPEALAWHLQQAGETEPAITCWAKASQAAVYRSDRQDAITFARNGLALLTPDMPNAAAHELSLQLSLGTALMAVEGYGSDRVGAALERAHSLGRVAGSFKSQARIRAGLWVHTWVAGKLPASIEHARALLDMARKTEDPSLLLQAHAGLGAVLVHTGDLATAMDHLHAGLDCVEPGIVEAITVQNAAVTCAAYASWVAGLQGDVAGMQAHCDRAFELGEVVNNPFAQAISRALCSESFMFVGDIDGCHRLAEEAVAISRERDFPFWLGTGLILSGWAKGWRGQCDDALARIDEGLAVFQATGAQVQLSNWFGLKAETHLLAGQLEPGLNMATLALDRARQTGDAWFSPRVHAIAAELCRQLGRDAEARRHDAQRGKLVDAAGLSATFAGGDIFGP